MPWNYFSLRVLMTECVSVKLFLSSAGYLMGFCRERSSQTWVLSRVSLTDEHFNLKFFCSLFRAVSDLACVYFIYGSVNKLLMWNHYIWNLSQDFFLLLAEPYFTYLVWTVVVCISHMACLHEWIN
jgi:hypothetical protein